jgi:hypothetical protein
MSKLRVMPLLCLAAWLPSLAMATELYRYVNDKGVVVIDRQGVPPEHIHRGYEVLNEQGRVTRVVPAAPPLEERQRLLEEKNRAKSDAQLLRLYGTPEDIERARARKLQELDGVISVARANLQSLRTQQANLQSQAADHERAGRAVPQHLLAQIDNLKAEQRRVRSDIQRFSDNRRQVDAEFLRDKARLVELWSR